jgi:hypothetical protein
LKAPQSPLAQRTIIGIEQHQPATMRELIDLARAELPGGATFPKT